MNANASKIAKKPRKSVDIKEEKNPYHYLNNKINHYDKNFHDWYRFVLSFPPHLVRHYIKDFGLNSTSTVLDPFCGTGTTLVEAKLNGIKSIGVEANPATHFASTVKVNWNVSVDDFQNAATKVAEIALRKLIRQGIDDDKEINDKKLNIKLQQLSQDANKLLLTNSISPLPLHKSLVLLDAIKKFNGKPFYNHLLLALAKALVFRISNLKFGPEVGVTKPKKDISVVSSWLSEIKSIISDLSSLNGKKFPKSDIFLGDSRKISALIKPASIDAVITSPPYPNEKDYTRTTRLESVLLGFMSDRNDLRQFKKTLIRSNTRNVYKEDDDYLWVESNKEIQKISNQIEKRRIELGKTSGFERLYGKVTRLYFGGMTRHLIELQKILKPGAKLAYVVGDQASYLRVMIRTGKIFSQIAEDLGYKLLRIDLFRTRLATTTGKQLREEVVVLEWTG